MSGGPSIPRLLKYAGQCLRLKDYLERPGDGRSFPRIPASDLMTALLASKVLRVCAFSGTEQLVRDAARGMGVKRSFGDDALAYFTERLDERRLRSALLALFWRAKRGKAFDPFPRLGLALDGTGAGRSSKKLCELCHPKRNKDREIIGHGHKMVGASVVAGALTLPLDVEYYPPGEGELTAGKRLLERVAHACRVRFDYVVVDGLYPGAPFLHLADQLRLPVVARLTDHLPELYAAAQKRFRACPATNSFTRKGERVELWDADDFIAWAALDWPRVRVLRYRQYRSDGTVVEAYWLTNFSSDRLSSRALYKLCKSRWQIENRFFNEAKNLYGLEHIPHHHAGSVLIHALLTCLAIAVERLYRLRHLHRGRRSPHSPIELHRLLWMNLRAAVPPDTS